MDASLPAALEKELGNEFDDLFGDVEDPDTDIMPPPPAPFNAAAAAAGPAEESMDSVEEKIKQQNWFGLASRFVGEGQVQRLRSFLETV
jgi:hypothetical protein